MNKFINILLLLITFPVIAFTIIVGFDFPLEFVGTSGANLPYRDIVFIVWAALLFIVGARRSIRRWFGVLMLAKKEKYRWNKPMSSQRYKQGNMYLILESLVHFVLAFALYTITKESMVISIVFVVLGFDHLIFLFIGNKKQLFRVGITSKAIVIADRDLKAVYFTGLREIDKQAQSIFFDYIKELQISFPVTCISDEDKASFKEELMQHIDENKVFLSESFKKF